MQNNNYPIDFKLQTRREDLRSDNYIEFFVGTFVNSVEYWNEGSVYIDHRAYKPLHPLFKKIKSSYNDYNVNEFNAVEIRELGISLKDFLKSLQQNPSNLSKKFNLSDLDIISKYELLVKGVMSKTEFAEVACKPFWVLGL